MMPPFKMTVEEVPGALVVHTEGDVDIQTAPYFHTDLIRNAQERPHHQHVIVDLTGVEFFGARGVHALEESHDLLRRSGQDLVVVAAPETISRRVLNIVNLPSRVTVVDSLPAAIKLAQKREGLGSRDQ